MQMLGRITYIQEAAYAHRNESLDPVGVSSALFGCNISAFYPLGKAPPLWLHASGPFTRAHASPTAMRHATCACDFGAKAFGETACKRATPCLTTTDNPRPNFPRVTSRHPRIHTHTHTSRHATCAHSASRHMHAPAHHLRTTRSHLRTHLLAYAPASPPRVLM